jgi:hypothetical protein
MTLEQFEELKKKVESDTTITFSNITDQILRIPQLYTEYLSLYTQQLRLLKRASMSVTMKYGELYHKYKFPNSNDGLNFQYHLDTKTEIDIYINSNSEYVKLKSQVQFQELVVKFLEEVLDNLKKIRFDVKNYIELMKLQNGSL